METEIPGLRGDIMKRSHLKYLVVGIIVITVLAPLTHVIGIKRWERYCHGPVPCYFVNDVLESPSRYLGEEFELLGLVVGCGVTTEGRWTIANYYLRDPRIGRIASVFGGLSTIHVRWDFTVPITCHTRYRRIVAWGVWEYNETYYLDGMGLGFW